MIVKCVSRKSNVGQLIKYVLAQHKTIPEKEANPISWRYVPLHNFTAREIQQLAAEKDDAVLNILRAEHKDLSLPEFIERYVIQGKETVNPQLGRKPLIVTHGLRSNDIDGYIKEFDDNEKQRKHTRKDSVRAYHHIISFSHLDTNFITEKMLRDVSQKYISLRGPDSLFIAVAHVNTDNAHLHLVQSGVKVGTGRAARISKQEFQEIKRTLQQYQKDNYPALVSLPEHGKSKNQKSKNMDTTKNISPERSVGEDVLLRVIETAFANSSSKDEFLETVRQAGHEPYFRDSRLAGIKLNGEDKYRLKTLGLTERQLDDLDRKCELEAMRNLREKQSSRATGTRKTDTKENELSRLDRFERAQTEEQIAITESAKELERDQAIEPDPAQDPEFELSDMTEEELDQMAEDMMAQEDERDKADEWGFSRDNDDAYEIDR